MTYFRSTITIWSDFDPSLIELSRLAQEAETGDAICTDFEIVITDDPGGDHTFNDDAISFFNLEDAYGKEEA